MTGKKFFWTHALKEDQRSQCTAFTSMKKSQRNGLNFWDKTSEVVRFKNIYCSQTICVLVSHHKTMTFKFFVERIFAWNRNVFKKSEIFRISVSPHMLLGCLVHTNLVPFNVGTDFYSYNNMNDIKCVRKIKVWTVTTNFFSRKTFSSFALFPVCTTITDSYVTSWTWFSFNF